MLILLLDDIKIINFLHAKFFRNITHFFIVLILYIFKKIININNFHLKKLIKNKNQHYLF